MSAPEGAAVNSPVGSATAERYRARQVRVRDYLVEHDYEAAVLVDLEGHRNSSVRYLCGHPQDALLFLFASGESLLLPWDVPLSERHAVVGSIRPFGDFGRSEETAIRSVLAETSVGSAELPGSLSYPLVESLKAALPGLTLSCLREGLELRLRKWRAVKDEAEVGALRRACELTDRLLREIEALLLEPPERGDAGIREVELALHLESRAREWGAEGMGFETLVAGPERSFAIHCFPPVSAGRFGGRGFSILDFGVVVEGYTSDVTVTAVRGPLSSRQEQMLNAVRGAYELAASLSGPGVEPLSVARAVDEHLQARGFTMPHSLGHGIGLEAHEEPLLRSREAAGSSGALQPGMVFTLEPGVYDPGEGGIRLENDFLCTGDGAEALTSAHLIRL